MTQATKKQGDSFILTDGATSVQFDLLGGIYAAYATATWGGGTAKLQILAVDGSTYISVDADTDFDADGFKVLVLPPGGYKITIATATDVYFAVTKVPSGLY